MKEKILQQLKAACGQNTSITDITLDKIADTLSAGITEETAIPAAIEAYKPVLQSIDGNINFVAANAVKNVKPIVPPVVTPPNPLDSNAEPAWFTAYKEQQLLTSKEITSKLEGFEKAKSREQMIAEAKSAFFKKYKISDSEKPLFNKAVDIELKSNPNHENAESLMIGLKTQYEDLRSAVGLGGVDPVGNNDGGSGGKKTPILNELKAKLQREGKLPTPTTT